MRNLQLFNKLILLTFVLVLSAGCQENEKVVPVKTGIDAEILNLSDSTVTLYSVISPLDKIRGKESAFRIDIDVDSNGIFVQPLKFDAGYYFFEYDENKILYFIQKGKKLSLDFDATKPTIKPDYSGKLKYESRYLYDRYFTYANFMANEAKYFEYNESAFIETVELLRGKMDTMLVMYIANHPTGSPYFMQQESLTNLYFMASYLAAYPHKRSRVVGDVMPLSDGYYKMIDGLNFNDTNALNNPEFYDFIQNYIWSKAGEPNSVANVMAQLEMVDSIFSVSEYKDYLRFKTAKEVAKWEPTSQRAQILDTLQSLISDEEIKHFLIKNIQSDTATVPNIENVILEDQ
jgi:hypothetical protein